MKHKLKKDCLILNKAWAPCNIVSARRAISITIKGRGKIIHPDTLIAYTFEEWIENGSGELGPETLTFKRKKYNIPTIICAIYYNNLHLRFTPINHPNIYKRDGYKCWYCGSGKDLTWDHIIPECKYGKTSWTNLITCCKKCNNDKDDMSVEEFCQMKKCEIPKPISLATTPWLLGRAQDLRPEWRKLLR